MQSLRLRLDRANGERVRLTYELANKNRQAEDPWAAGRDGSTGRDTTGGIWSIAAKNEFSPIRLVTGHEDRGVVDCHTVTEPTVIFGLGLTIVLIGMLFLNAIFY
jgi:hypothetical protein